eukprot:490083-Hanusia_phi.AAC.1
MFSSNGQSGFNSFQMNNFPTLQDSNQASSHLANNSGMSYGISVGAENSLQSLLQANNAKSILMQVEQINELIKMLEEKRNLLLQGLPEASGRNRAMALLGQATCQTTAADSFSSGFLHNHHANSFGSSSHQAGISHAAIGTCLQDCKDPSLIQTPMNQNAIGHYESHNVVSDLSTTRSSIEVSVSSSCSEGRDLQLSAAKRKHCSDSDEDESSSSKRHESNLPGKI